MGQLLSHPLTEKSIEYNDYKQFANFVDSDRKLITPRFFNCVGSMQGYRLTQEDAHLILNENGSSDKVRVRFYNPFENRVEYLKLTMFGVFDGHGGSECSLYLSGQHPHYHHRNNNNSSSNESNSSSAKDAHMSGKHSSHSYHQGIAKWIVYCFENHEYGAYDVSVEHVAFKRKFRTIEGLISQIIKDAFILQDQELYSYFAKSSCGSTAVVAIIINDKNLYVANTGDSRSILCSKSEGIKTMSFDHKPQHIGELLRINDGGGTVSLGRVGGVLALSRAFSDFQFKRNVQYNTNSKKSHLSSPHEHTNKNLKNTGIPPQEAQVTVEPDVLMHKLSYSRDEFLVLACDGIWDVYSNKQLSQFIKYYLTLGMKLDTIMTKLLDHGIAQANSDTGVGFDNMTAIIIALNKPGESLAEWYTRMKSRLEREKGLH
ncbi:hypothetical protein Kpol_1043p40 [Vanderwaltozyma polyspora DSM 70294]|uniref:protein-serine/threonine phosphatase n=1 Tax=Vanderwaltozyma polyspora (strain ATCC 22028 / DSM 70294 / BCRC 21397 / CBS 2163 / NBRC 10782 / NRRL Y-8283 / UCD 57-17) TaxID=436907 RepID=A7TIQ8_VANPO|nr:uncharacterized protein Kpol_1043p40 [Vanderwaltozyma polyspora DSM 70294]EDO17850.1 hypothetical protein Kpol_1043p40 [Vanderwaltozyma polyspora DSM 70294]